MTRLLFILTVGTVLGAGAAFLFQLVSRVEAAPASADSPIHTQRTFEFTVELPLQAAAPLFGADKERVWAAGWNPTFLWPESGKDQRGMVFTVAHGSGTAVWIAPTFDPANGLIQYVNVVPGVMVTLINLRLTPLDQRTHVSVQYERTALSAAAKDVVLEMADHDNRSGPEWEKQISEYLKLAKAR